MPSAAALRLEIERTLERHFPAALTPAPPLSEELAATGIAEIDAQLGGGLPIGAVSELVGPHSSGRTSLALAFAAGRTAEGRACAWVDASDAFDPESAAASGVLLRLLLWVRCSDTPPSTQSGPAQAGVWTRLEQALRATDLLLQASGFSCLVLDLGDIEPERASRIPLATWFRFRQAAERARSSLLVLGRAAYAQSAAALVLGCHSAGARPVGRTALSGFGFRSEPLRERFEPLGTGLRKGPASTWTVPAAWDRENRA
jgi:recombination protein RecA